MPNVIVDPRGEAGELAEARGLQVGIDEKVSQVLREQGMTGLGSVNSELHRPIVRHTTRSEHEDK